MSWCAGTAPCGLRFAEVDGEPVQAMAPAGEAGTDAGAQVRVLALSGPLPEDLAPASKARAANSELHALFSDLERGPLPRVTWIERAPGQVPGAPGCPAPHRR